MIVFLPANYFKVKINNMMASNPCLKYAPFLGGEEKMMSIHMIDNLSK